MALQIPDQIDLDDLEHCIEAFVVPQSEIGSVDRSERTLEIELEGAGLLLDGLYRIHFEQLDQEEDPAFPHPEIHDWIEAEVLPLLRREREQESEAVWEEVV